MRRDYPGEETTHYCQGNWKLQTGSLKQLEGIIRKLEKTGIFEQYDAIIRDQLTENVVEPVAEHMVGHLFCITCFLLVLYNVIHDCPKCFYSVDFTSVGNLEIIK